MGAEQQDNELTDVVLCYQAMGVPLDASPDQIAKMHKALIEEYKKKLTSPDPATREEGRQSLALVGEMYEKIRGSITYRAMEQDYLKRKENGLPEPSLAKPVVRVAREHNPTMQCPRCNGTVPKGATVCPVCKSRIQTGTEKLLQSLFSKKVVICVLVVLALGASCFFLLNQNGSKGKDGISDLDTLEKKAP